MLSFIGSCDRVRRNNKGEKLWHEMMQSKIEISENEFLKAVDLYKLLDENETWEEYKSSLQDIKYYKSNNVSFFQTEGFEFIFA